MKVFKGIIGFILFSVGTFALSAFIMINADMDPTRGSMIFILFLSIGMGRLGYGFLTGSILKPKIPTKLNKKKLKNLLYKDK
jgi:hypothetical protein